MRSGAVKFGFGQSPPRKEDGRLVTGRGTYTADILPEGTVYAAFVSSPYGRARILGVDLSAVREAEGVLGAYEWSDVEAAGLRALEPVFRLNNRDGSPMFVTRRKLLAEKEVRFAGELVAMVVARTEEEARDAAELAQVDYEPLEAVTGLEEATREGATKVWEGCESNVALDWFLGDEEKTNKAFAEASHVTTLKLRNNRVAANPLEPRAATGEYDEGTGRWTLHVGTQGTHNMAAHVSGALGVEATRVRVLTKDVGGGFGMKIFIYPEYPLVLFAARELGLPVSWVGTRREGILTDAQGRGHETEASLAFDGDGRATGLKVETLGHLGAYVSQFGAMILTRAAAGMHVGVYGIGALSHRVRGVFTNTTPTDAYRGAGRPEASYVIERLMEKAAREMGLDSVELRRRNFVKKEELGTTEAPVLPFDSGDFERVMGEGLSELGYKGGDWEGRKKRAKELGKRLGVGMSYYVERTAAGMPEHARLRVDGEGTVHVYAGSQSTGQGHETVWTQLVCDGLGVEAEQVLVHMGDSDALSGGGGSGGSRSLYMVANALEEARDGLVLKGRRAAAGILESSVEDVEYRLEEGGFGVVGTDRKVSLFEAAKRAEEDDSLEAMDHEGSRVVEKGTYPNGCHICEVEVDEATGAVDILRYVAVDDFGKLGHPEIVRGQVHGGIVQGLGQAVGEEVRYDEDGQLLNASFMDYYMPRAGDVPSFEVSFVEDAASRTNELGVKGCGEAGAVAAPSAYLNALTDALWGLEGAGELQMPVTSQSVWRVLKGGQQR